MDAVLSLHQTTIGRKAIVAVTGLVMFLFLIGHLLGNLQIFLGPEALNGYAAKLRTVPEFLWVARAGLVVAVVAHIWASISLASRNTDARPTPYKHKRHNQVTSYAARTMVWSGPIIGLYLVYHLLHLTLGFGSGYEHDHQNVYNNVVYSFQQPLIAGFYMLANLLMATHLFHGAWSWLQSLGANHPRYNGLRRTFAFALAIFIGGGNIFIPGAVLSGLVTPTDETFCYPELARVDGECDGRESH